MLSLIQETLYYQKSRNMNVEGQVWTEGFVFERIFTVWLRDFLSQTKLGYLLKMQFLGLHSRSEGAHILIATEGLWGGAPAGFCTERQQDGWVSYHPPPPPRTLMNLQRHLIIPSSPWCTLEFSIGVGLSLDLDKCVRTHSHHYSILESISLP